MVILLITMIPTAHVHVGPRVQNVEFMKKLSLELVPMELFLDLYLLLFKEYIDGRVITKEGELNGIVNSEQMILKCFGDTFTLHK